jgi:hypothetical protein
MTAVERARALARASSHAAAVAASEEADAIETALRASSLEP